MLRSLWLTYQSKYFSNMFRRECMSGHDVLKKSVRHLCKGAAWTTKQIIKGTLYSAEIAYDNRDLVPKAVKLTAIATASSARSAGAMLYDTASLKIFSNGKIETIKKQIEEQGLQYRSLTIHRMQHHRNIDTLAVGGDLLKDILDRGASPDVNAAFAAAYPREAQHISFEEAIRNTPDEHLNGFISGVKGKLFEMKYVDYLNDGNLPDGYSASLAGSATQPGWDIAIKDADGNIDDLLQMKATNSVEYVQHALERYPDIDVVTTDEVYSQLVMNGAADHVMSSGISNADITNHVVESINGSEIQMHWTPPIISLALIAFTTYRHDELNDEQKARYFGERSGKSYVSYLIGGGIAAITQTWWLGMLAGVGTRYLATKGRGQREIHGELMRIVNMNEYLIKQLKVNIQK